MTQQEHLFLNKSGQEKILEMMADVFGRLEKIRIDVKQILALVYVVNYVS